VMRTADLLPKDQERLTVIHDQAKRAASLIGQILDFSRRSLMERSSFAFIPFLEDFVGLMERTLPENIRIEMKINGGQYIMEGDPARLQQVLMNLGLNARDAMPEGGDLIIGLGHLKIRPGQRPPSPGLTPGDWLRLTVSDNGAGIEPQDLPHVFEPFFTTKPPGQGTGLGLSQVYGIVRQHGGHTDVSSQPGQGTTVTIYLPVVKLTDTAPLDSSVVDRELISGSGETVLVVEDDQATRQAVRDTLESLDYRVLEAADGNEALVVYEQHDRDIALVLSDLVMPGMGGGPLLQNLRQRDPNLKVILMTGYPLEESGQELLTQGIVAWLAKPFTAGAVGDAVHRALVGEDGDGDPAIR
jgi:two-component system cell cycle sensor histidine kinase/response regulator CckA